MDEIHRNILMSNFVYLTKNIHNIEAICDELLEDGVLTPGMVESVKCKTPKPTAQVRELLSTLPRRGRNAYKCFIKALIKTENKDLADRLEGKDDPHRNTNATKLMTVPTVQIVNENWPDLEKGCKMVQEKDIVSSNVENLDTIPGNSIYHMTGSKKGKVIIISNVKCAPESSENGCCDCADGETDSIKTDNQNNKENNFVNKCGRSVDFDKTTIQQLFRHMKFESPSPWKNITKEEIKDKLRETVEGKDASAYDSLVVVILSGGQSYEADKMYDKNGEIVDRKEIVQIMKETPAFKHKPKIVIFRTYNFEDIVTTIASKEGDRSENKNEGQHDTLDAGLIKLLLPNPNNEDIFVVTAISRTAHGPWIIGRNMTGSYFIQALVHIFKHQAHIKTFLDLLEEINKCLHTAMVPENNNSIKGKPTVVSEVKVLEYSNNKELYFFPKIIGVKK